MEHCSSTSEQRIQCLCVCMRFQKHVHFFRFSFSTNSNPGALFQKKHPTAFASCISNLWLNLKLHFKRQESTSGCKEACSTDPVGIYGMCKYGRSTKHFRDILARTVLVPWVRVDSIECLFCSPVFFGKTWRVRGSWEMLGPLVYKG